MFRLLFANPLGKQGLICRGKGGRFHFELGPWEQRRFCVEPEEIKNQRWLPVPSACVQGPLEEDQGLVRKARGGWGARSFCGKLRGVWPQQLARGCIGWLLGKSNCPKLQRNWKPNTI